MASRRKICIVTGTRAEYGILSALMSEIVCDSELKLQVVVTGAHLSGEFGNTYQHIEDDGFCIDEKVDVLMPGDSRVSITKSTGKGVIGFADAYDRLRPDLIVVLGDRYEILAAAQAALLMSIPLAHIHGGEITEGAVDESIRHAITKMAHLHFTSTERYRQRVIQMGENPANVFAFGAPGLDNFVRLQLPSHSSLEESLGVKLKEPVFLVTYHPETLADETPEGAVKPLLDSLASFGDAMCVVTKANADAGGKTINAELDAFAEKFSDRVVLVSSLGQARYLGMLKVADVVIGNSSSGIIEAPAVGTPTVNIGSRQKGRLRASSVVDCANSSQAISAAIVKCLSNSFRKEAFAQKSPYGQPGLVSKEIKDILKTIELEGMLVKRFFDMDGNS